MQCSNLAAKVQQFVKDCSSSSKPYFGGRKYVNGDSAYILVTDN
jgi:hypothetical protein